jgi:UDP-N-acetylglucosamine enolpyruvyl transferase
MDKLKIRGGKRLQGTLDVSGAKTPLCPSCAPLC